MSRALEDDWLAPRRTAVVDLLVEGARRGEVRSDLDHDTVADVLFAPIYDRLCFNTSSSPRAADRNPGCRLARHRRAEQAPEAKTG